jgi:hypothetical protein
MIRVSLSTELEDSTMSKKTWILLSNLRTTWTLTSPTCKPWRTSCTMPNKFMLGLLTSTMMANSLTPLLSTHWLKRRLLGLTEGPNNYYI